MEDEKELDQLGEAFAYAAMPTSLAGRPKDPRCKHCGKCWMCFGLLGFCGAHWACKYCSYSCMNTGEPVYCKDPKYCAD